jgi:hypothetical protein
VVPTTPSPLPASEPVDQAHEGSGIIPGDRPEFTLPTSDNTHRFLTTPEDVHRPTTPPQPELSFEDSRALLTRLTGLQPWQLEAFPDELPPLPLSRPGSPTRSPEVSRPTANFSQRRLSSTAVPIRFRKPTGSPVVQRDLAVEPDVAPTPLSGLSPSRSRHGKTHSTEFKSSREFRPLYLVERNRKSDEIDEVLPALPSSAPPSEASGTESEGEYESALESPHQSTGHLAGDSFFESTISDLISPRRPGPELQHPQLADRELEELEESGQATPKASEFTVPHAHAQSVGPNYDSLTAALEVARAQEQDESTDDAFMSTSNSPRSASPLAASAPLDDGLMRDNRVLRSGHSSPRTSSSRLQDAALGAVVGGLTAAALRERSHPPTRARSETVIADSRPVAVEEQTHSEPAQVIAVVEPKGKAKAKKNKKGKKSVISEPSLPTPAEEKVESMPSSQYIPTFVEDEDDWAKNKAESIFTDEATLIGEPVTGASDSKLLQQKVLDSTAPQHDEAAEVRRAIFDDNQSTIVGDVEASEESKQEFNQSVDLTADPTSKISEDAVVEPVTPIEITEPPAAEPVVEEEPVTTPKAKKGKKSKNGKRGSQQAVPEPSSLPEASAQDDYILPPPQSQQETIELKILGPSIEDAGKRDDVAAMDLLVKEDDVALESTTPAVVASKEDLPIEPVVQPTEPILKEEPAAAPVTESSETLSKDVATPTQSEAEQAASGWSSGLWGALGWGKKKATSPTASPRVSPPSSPKPRSAVLAALAAAQEAKKLKRSSSSSTIERAGRKSLEREVRPTSSRSETQDMLPRPQLQLETSTEAKTTESTPHTAFFTDDGKPSFAFPQRTTTPKSAVEETPKELSSSGAETKSSADTTPHTAFFTDDGKPSFTFPEASSTPTVEPVETLREVPVIVGDTETSAYVPPQNVFFTDDGKPAFTFPTILPTPTEQPASISSRDTSAPEEAQTPAYVAPRNAFFTDDGKPSFAFPPVFSAPKGLEATFTIEETKPSNEAITPASSEPIAPADESSSFEPSSSKKKKSKKAKKASVQISEPVEREPENVSSADAPIDTAVEAWGEQLASEPVESEVEASTPFETPMETAVDAWGDQLIADLPTSTPAVEEPSTTVYKPDVSDKPQSNVRDVAEPVWSAQPVSDVPTEHVATQEPTVPESTTAGPSDPAEEEASPVVSKKKGKKGKKVKRESTQDETPFATAPSTPAIERSLDIPVPEPVPVTEDVSFSESTPVETVMGKKETTITPQPEAPVLEPMSVITKTTPSYVPVEGPTATERASPSELVPSVTEDAPKAKKSKKNKKKSGTSTPQLEAEPASESSTLVAERSVATQEPTESSSDRQLPTEPTQPDAADVPLPAEPAQDDLAEPLETETTKEVLPVSESTSAPAPTLPETEADVAPKAKKTKKNKKSGIYTPQPEVEVAFESAAPAPEPSAPISEPVVTPVDVTNQPRDLVKPYKSGQIDAATIPLPEDNFDDDLIAPLEQDRPSEDISPPADLDAATVPLPEAQFDEDLSVPSGLAKPSTELPTPVEPTPEDVSATPAAKKDKKKKKDKKSKGTETPVEDAQKDIDIALGEPSVQEYVKSKEVAEEEMPFEQQHRAVNIAKPQDVGIQDADDQKNTKPVATLDQPQPDAATEQPITRDIVEPMDEAFNPAEPVAGPQPEDSTALMPETPAPEPSLSAEPMVEDNEVLPSSSKKDKKKKGTKGKPAVDEPSTPILEVQRELEVSAEPTQVESLAKSVEQVEQKPVVELVELEPVFDSSVVPRSEPNQPTAQPSIETIDTASTEPFAEPSQSTTSLEEEPIVSTKKSKKKKTKKGLTEEDVPSTPVAEVQREIQVEPTIEPAKGDTEAMASVSEQQQESKPIVEPTQFDAGAESISDENVPETVITSEDPSALASAQPEPTVVVPVAFQPEPVGDSSQPATPLEEEPAPSSKKAKKKKGKKEKSIDIEPTTTEPADTTTAAQPSIEATQPKTTVEVAPTATSEAVLEPTGADLDRAIDAAPEAPAEPVQKAAQPLVLTEDVSHKLSQEAQAVEAAAVPIPATPSQEIPDPLLDDNPASTPKKSKKKKAKRGKVTDTEPSTPVAEKPEPQLGPHPEPVQVEQPAIQATTLEQDEPIKEELSAPPAELVALPETDDKDLAEPIPLAVDEAIKVDSLAPSADGHDIPVVEPEKSAADVSVKTVAEPIQAVVAPSAPNELFAEGEPVEPTSKKNKKKKGKKDKSIDTTEPSTPVTEEPAPQSTIHSETVETIVPPSQDASSTTVDLPSAVEPTSAEHNIVPTEKIVSHGEPFEDIVQPSQDVATTITDVRPASEPTQTETNTDNITPQMQNEPNQDITATPMHMERTVDDESAEPTSKKAKKKKGKKGKAGQDVEVEPTVESSQPEPAASDASVIIQPATVSDVLEDGVKKEQIPDITQPGPIAPAEELIEPTADTAIPETPIDSVNVAAEVAPEPSTNLPTERELALEVAQLPGSVSSDAPLDGTTTADQALPMTQVPAEVEDATTTSKKSKKKKAKKGQLSSEPQTPITEAQPVIRDAAVQIDPRPTTSVVTDEPITRDDVSKPFTEKHLKPSEEAVEEQVTTAVPDPAQLLQEAPLSAPVQPTVDEPALEQLSEQVASSPLLKKDKKKAKKAQKTELESETPVVHSTSIEEVAQTTAEPVIEAQTVPNAREVPIQEPTLEPSTSIEATPQDSMSVDTTEPEALAPTSTLDEYAATSTSVDATPVPFGPVDATLTQPEDVSIIPEQKPEAEEESTTSKKSKKKAKKSKRASIVEEAAATPIPETPVEEKEENVLFEQPVASTATVNEPASTVQEPAPEIVPAEQPTSITPAVGERALETVPVDVPAPDVAQPDVPEGAGSDTVSNKSKKKAKKDKRVSIVEEASATPIPETPVKEEDEFALSEQPASAPDLSDEPVSASPTVAESASQPVAVEEPIPELQPTSDVPVEPTVDVKEAASVSKTDKKKAKKDKRASIVDEAASVPIPETPTQEKEKVPFLEQPVSTPSTIAGRTADVLPVEEPVHSTTPTAEETTARDVHEEDAIPLSKKDKKKAKKTKRVSIADEPTSIPPTPLEEKTEPLLDASTISTSPVVEGPIPETLPAEVSSTPAPTFAIKQEPISLATPVEEPIPAIASVPEEPALSDAAVEDTTPMSKKDKKKAKKAKRGSTAESGTSIPVETPAEETKESPLDIVAPVRDEQSSARPVTDELSTEASTTEPLPAIASVVEEPSKEEDRSTAVTVDEQLSAKPIVEEQSAEQAKTTTSTVQHLPATEQLSNVATVDEYFPATPGVTKQPYEAVPIEQTVATPEDAPASTTKKDNKKAKKAKRGSVVDIEPSVPSTPIDELVKELVEEVKDAPIITPESATSTILPSQQETIEREILEPSFDPVVALPISDEPVVPITATEETTLEDVPEETASPKSKKDKKKAKKSAKLASTTEGEPSESSIPAEQLIEEARSIPLDDAQPATPLAPDKHVVVAPSGEQPAFPIEATSNLAANDQHTAMVSDAPNASTIEASHSTAEEPSDATTVVSEDTSDKLPLASNPAEEPTAQPIDPVSAQPNVSATIDSPSAASPLAESKQDDEQEPAEWTGLSKSQKKKLKKAKRASLAEGEPSQPSTPAEEMPRESTLKDLPTTEEAVVESKAADEEPVTTVSNEQPASSSKQTEEQLPVSVTVEEPTKEPRPAEDQDATTTTALAKPAGDPEPPDKEPDDPPLTSKSSKKKAKKQAKKDESFLAGETPEAANSETQSSPTNSKLSETPIPFSGIPTSYPLRFTNDELVDISVERNEENEESEKEQGGDDVEKKVEGGDDESVVTEKDVEEQKEEKVEDVLVGVEKQEPATALEEALDRGVGVLEGVEGARPVEVEQPATLSEPQQPVIDEVEIATAKKSKKEKKRASVAEEPVPQAPSPITEPAPTLAEPTTTAEVESATVLEAPVIPEIAQEPSLPVQTTDPQPLDESKDVPEDIAPTSTSQPEPSAGVSVSTNGEPAEDLSISELDRNIPKDHGLSKDTVAHESETPATSTADVVKPTDEITRPGDVLVVSPQFQLNDVHDSQANEKLIEDVSTRNMEASKPLPVAVEEQNDPFAEPEAATPIEADCSIPTDELAPAVIVDTQEPTVTAPMAAQQPQETIDPPTSSKKNKKKSKKNKQQYDTATPLEALPEVQSVQPEEPASSQLEQVLSAPAPVTEHEVSRDLHEATDVPQQLEDMQLTTVTPEVHHAVPEEPTLAPIGEVSQAPTPIIEQQTPVEIEEVPYEQTELPQPVAEPSIEPQPLIDELQASTSSKKDKKKNKKAKKQSESATPVDDVMPEVQQLSVEQTVQPQVEPIVIEAINEPAVVEEDAAVLQPEDAKITTEAKTGYLSQPEELQLTATETIAEPLRPEEQRSLPEANTEPTQPVADEVNSPRIPEATSEEPKPTEESDVQPGSNITGQIGSASRSETGSTTEAEPLPTPVEEQLPVNATAAAPLSKKDKKKAKKGKAKASDAATPAIEDAVELQAQVAPEASATEPSDELSTVEVVPVPALEASRDGDNADLPYISTAEPEPTLDDSTLSASPTNKGEKDGKKSDTATPLIEDVSAILPDTALEGATVESTEQANPGNVPLPALIEDPFTQQPVTEELEDVPSIAPQEEVLAQPVPQFVDDDATAMPVIEGEPSSPFLKKKGKKKAKKSGTVTPIVEGILTAKHEIVNIPTEDVAPTTVSAPEPVETILEEQPEVKDSALPAKTPAIPEDSLQTDVVQSEPVPDEQVQESIQFMVTAPSEEVEVDVDVEKPVLNRKLSKKEKKARKQAAALDTEPILESEPVTEQATERTIPAVDVTDTVSTESVHHPTSAEIPSTLEPLIEPETTRDLPEQIEPVAETPIHDQLLGATPDASSAPVSKKGKKAKKGKKSTTQSADIIVPDDVTSNLPVLPEQVELPEVSQTELIVTDLQSSLDQHSTTTNVYSEELPIEVVQADDQSLPTASHIQELVEQPRNEASSSREAEVALRTGSTSAHDLGITSEALAADFTTPLVDDIVEPAVSRDPVSDILPVDETIVEPVTQPTEIDRVPTPPTSESLPVTETAFLESEQRLPEAEKSEPVLSPSTSKKSKKKSKKDRKASNDIEHQPSEPATPVSELPPIVGVDAPQSQSEVLPTISEASGATQRSASPISKYLAETEQELQPRIADVPIQDVSRDIFYHTTEPATAPQQAEENEKEVNLPVTELSLSLKAIQDEAGDLRLRAEALDDELATGDAIGESSYVEPTSMFDIVNKLTKKDKKKAKKNKGTVSDSALTTPAAEPEAAVEIKEVVETPAIAPIPIIEAREVTETPLMEAGRVMTDIPSHKLSKKDEKRKGLPPVHSFDEPSKTSNDQSTLIPNEELPSTFEPQPSEQIPEPQPQTTMNTDFQQTTSSEPTIVETSIPSVVTEDVPETVVEEPLVLSRKLSKKDKKKAKQAALVEDALPSPSETTLSITSTETRDVVLPNYEVAAPATATNIEGPHATRVQGVPDTPVVEHFERSPELSNDTAMPQTTSVTRDEPSTELSKDISQSQDDSTFNRPDANVHGLVTMTEEPTKPTSHVATYLDTAPDVTEPEPLAASCEPLTTTEAVHSIDKDRSIPPIQEEPIIAPAFARKQSEKKDVQADQTEPETLDDIVMAEAISADEHLSKALQPTEEASTATHSIPLPQVSEDAQRNQPLDLEPQIPEDPAKAPEMLASATAQTVAVQPETKATSEKSKKKRKSKTDITTSDEPTNITPTAITEDHAPNPSIVSEPMLVDPPTEAVVQEQALTPVSNEADARPEDISDELKDPTAAAKVGFPPPAFPVRKPNEALEAAKPPTLQKKSSKKHKLAALFERGVSQDTAAEQSLRRDGSGSVKNLAERYESQSRPVTPVQSLSPEKRSVSRIASRNQLVLSSPQRSDSKSPAREIDFAATVAASLEESGFDPGYVINDRSFSRSTSAQGTRDIAPDDEVATAKERASRSRLGSLSRSSSFSASPKLRPTRQAEANVLPPIEVALASTDAISFDPLDVLNDPAFSTRKSPPGVLEEADPDELAASSSTLRRTKGKKKRRSLPETPLEPEIVNIPDDARTAVIEEFQAATRTVAEEKTLDAPIKEGKKTKKGRLQAPEQDSVEYAAAETPVIETLADVPLAVEPPVDSTVRAVELDRSVPDVPSLPSTFDQESRTLTAGEPDEYPFPVVVPNEETSQPLREELHKKDLEKERDMDAWAPPLQKKEKKSRKGKGKAESGVEETARRNEPTESERTTHEPHKRRTHPVSFDEEQPDEKRLHTLEQSQEAQFATRKTASPPQIAAPERSTLDTQAIERITTTSEAPPMSRSPAPATEPLWSFAGLRDTAAPVAASLTQELDASVRKSAVQQYQAVETPVRTLKRRSKEPKTPLSAQARAVSASQEMEDSPALPQYPTSSGVPTPGTDYATKERTSYLFDSSPSTRAYGTSPAITPQTPAQDNRRAAETPSEDKLKSSQVKESYTDLHHGRMSPTMEIKQEPYQSLFGDPSENKSDKSARSSTPTTKYERTPGTKQLESITESSPPDDTPSVRKVPRSLADVGVSDRGLKSARRTGSPKMFSERLKSPPPVTPTPTGRRSATPTLESTAGKATPSRDSPWHQVHDSIDRTMTLSPARQMPRSSPSSDPLKQSIGERRSSSAQSQRSVGNIARLRSPDQDRPISSLSNRPLSSLSNHSAHSLRRVDRQTSGDLRSASRLGGVSAQDAKSAQPNLSDIAAGATAAIAGIAGVSRYDPVRGEGKARRSSMAETFVSFSSSVLTFVSGTDRLLQEALGEARGSPMSPTRPPSVRKRQSIQLMDLQSQLNQVAEQNESLEYAKARAEEALQAAQHQRQVDEQLVAEEVEARDRQIHQRDIDIAQLRDTLQRLQEEITRLKELNNAMTDANHNLTNDANERYGQLQAEGQLVYDQWQTSQRELENLRSQHGQTTRGMAELQAEGESLHQKWQTSQRELETLRNQHDTLRNQHNQMTSGMADAIRDEVGTALDERNAEIDRLNGELTAAREQVKTLQKQILASKKPSESFLTVRDEDYFDSACQQLCQHVQQWVLRFSKFSDTRACRLSSEISADTRLDKSTRQKIDTRLDNSILDGSDVDSLLADRVKRRDVFMSVVMTMIWEYVFTRYLFGMDREQRQKLKALEKTLSEVGPPRAVAQWRAITLTLLAKREPFMQQRAQDTEAVVHEIYSTLTTLLPPPSHLQRQIQESLRNVMRLAVELSIEMRTQRAEYIMLPPLQPEYDTNGDLIAKVTFNASLMNERSGETTSNDELEAKGAVVKIVLFPLVVKKGDDFGEGEDEIVVCPAQVLVAGSKNKKVVRVMSGAMSVINRPDSRASRMSGISRMTSVVPDSAMMDTSGPGSNMI